jgi:hypothetical protein
MSELHKELKTHPIQGPKDGFYFTKDFMVTLFRLMYTYQTIGAEVVKESCFSQRVEYLREGDRDNYQQSILKNQKSGNEIKVEVRNIIFDYFNIIVKEYEFSYQRYCKEPDYTKQINAIQEEVDKDFVTSKYQVPEGLTKEKAEEIFKERSAAYRENIMKSINLIQ